MPPPPMDPSHASGPIPFDAVNLSASLTVADLPTSVRWYRDVIGFVRILLTQDNGAKGERRTKGEGLSLQFTTRASIDDLAAGIVARGGLLESEPADAFGARVFRVRDGDGFLLVISSQREEAVP